MKPGMNPKAVLAAIVGSLCSIVVVLGCWNYSLHRRISKLEQLDRIQSEINIEQEQWDENAADRLNQETEANQL